MESFGKKWKSGHLSDSKKQQKSLVLHNDNINSFDYVIDQLCEICEHDNIQAEQCAFITHFKGKCQIKVGSAEELRPYRDILSSKKLHVTID